MKEQLCLSVVSPVFNEEAVIRSFYDELVRVLREVGVSYEVVFVDDGSRDGTFIALSLIRNEDPGHVRVVRLARNFGHQLAITAGMQAAKGQAVVVMDCDLQDPPALIADFLRHWREGNQVVYGRRTSRRNETWFKKFSAFLFYRLLRRLTRIDIPADAGDFYLLDRRVLDILNGMEERHRFLRGLIAWSGFRRVAVEYVRQGRLAGETKFSLWKMFKFSLDAVTSFSFVPLRMVSFFGFLVSLVAFVGILVTAYIKLFTAYTVTGWASLMVVVLFLGGIQLVSIGIIGEYIARIGDDVKRRPLYTVQEMLG